MEGLSDVLRALFKLVLSGVWLLLAFLMWMWGYGICKSIGRVHTQSNAGEFLTPNDADVYPIFFIGCGFILFLVTLAIREVRWPWPKQD